MTDSGPLTENDEGYQCLENDMIRLMTMPPVFHSDPAVTRERALQEIASQTSSVISFIFTAEHKTHRVSRELVQLLVLKKIEPDLIGGGSKSPFALVTQ
jgi:hypothetical protein